MRGKNRKDSPLCDVNVKIVLLHRFCKVQISYNSEKIKNVYVKWDDIVPTQNLLHSVKIYHINMPILPFDFSVVLQQTHVHILNLNLQYFEQLYIFYSFASSALLVLWNEMSIADNIRQQYDLSTITVFPLHAFVSIPPTQAASVPIPSLRVPNRFSSRQY